MQPWIEQELRTVRLADERLNSRYRVLLDRLSSKPTLSLPAACNGWAETQAAYRFFDNDRNTPEELLRPHYDATLERIRPYPVVLIAQDTTEFDLTRAREKVGGPLGDERHWGLHDHVALAVTPQRLALGVVPSFTWGGTRTTSINATRRGTSRLRPRRASAGWKATGRLSGRGRMPRDADRLSVGQRRGHLRAPGGRRRDRGADGGMDRAGLPGPLLGRRKRREIVGAGGVGAGVGDPGNRGEHATGPVARRQQASAGSPGADRDGDGAKLPSDVAGAATAGLGNWPTWR